MQLCKKQLLNCCILWPRAAFCYDNRGFPKACLFELTQRRALGLLSVEYPVLASSKKQITCIRIFVESQSRQHCCRIRLFVTGQFNQFGKIADCHIKLCVTETETQKLFSDTIQQAIGGVFSVLECVHAKRMFHKCVCQSRLTNSASVITGVLSTQISQV